MEAFPEKVGGAIVRRLAQPDHGCALELVKNMTVAIIPASDTTPIVIEITSAVLVTISPRSIAFLTTPQCQAAMTASRAPKPTIATPRYTDSSVPFGVALV